MLRLARTVLLLLLALVILAGCPNQNPARPRNFTAEEIEAPVYDTYYETFGEGQDRTYGTILYTTQGMNGPQLVDAKTAATVFLPIVEHPDMILHIAYNANPKTDPPPMQLQLLGRVDADGRASGDYGDPVVLCDLNQQQVNWVFVNEIPQPLIDEMIQVAIDAGWSKDLTVPNQFGRFILVDADGYIPPTTNAEDKVVDDEAEPSDQPPD